MITLSLMVAAVLFGGMVLYSFGFAAFVFSALPTDTARTTIRKAFPHFYSFVIVAAVLAAGLSWSNDSTSAALLLAVAVTAVLARQILMPAINRATDNKQTSRFKWLHGASVLLTLTHIVVAGFVLARYV
jgi:prepilin signal peptidase PulO-like enzyme (type II secretory pathway)